jgi:hypothetical protein
MLTVFDALSMTVKTPPSSLLSPTPSLSLLSTPQFTGTQYAVTPVTSCVPATTYAPGSTRFRMFTTASTDSSHVYVSICDGGAIADIDTTTSTISTGGSNAPDSLITDIIAPFGGCAAATLQLRRHDHIAIHHLGRGYIPGSQQFHSWSESVDFRLVEHPRCAIEWSDRERDRDRVVWHAIRGCGFPTERRIDCRLRDRRPVVPAAKPHFPAAGTVTPLPMTARDRDYVEERPFRPRISRTKMSRALAPDCGPGA